MFTDNAPTGFYNQQNNNQRPSGGSGAPGGPGHDNQYGGGMRRNPQTEVRKSKVFTPVTVRMVMNAQPRPDDICEFDGDPVNDIILCGRLLRRVEEPMRTQFEINDNTGTFYVLFYHKGENQVPTALRNFQYDQFCYAKVYGNIRVFKEEKAIVGTHIKRIEKFDELTNHFLSTYVAHCIRKKGVLKPRELAIDQNQANQMTEMAGAAAAGPGAGSGMVVDQMGAGRAPGGHGDFSAGGANSFDLRKTLIQVMRELEKSNKFIHKENVYSVVQDKTDKKTFDAELEKMLGDGDICQAFDQHHYCLVE